MDESELTPEEEWAILQRWLLYAVTGLVVAILIGIHAKEYGW